MSIYNTEQIITNIKQGWIINICLFENVYIAHVYNTQEIFAYHHLGVNTQKVFRHDIRAELFIKIDNHIVSVEKDVMERLGINHA